MIRKCSAVLLLYFSSSALALAQGESSAQQAPAAVARGADMGNRTILPLPAPPFTGKIGTTYRDSVPAPRPSIAAPANAPNVLVILTDDVGFGAASTFGGPVPTPNLDQLAKQGLLYNRFHTTAMCSPTRAALLTGRNHHAVGNGVVTGMLSNFPGYDGQMPRTAATIAQVLKYNGYNTAMVGKHHNTPPADSSVAGPFDQWPVGLGFEHFYGFLGGDTNQWRPHLYRNTEAVPDQPPAGETLDHLLVDDAISWIDAQKAAAPNKPFFLYFAPGSAHAPHQAPAAWIERFRGKFDDGWDALRETSLKRQLAGGIVPKGTRLTPRPATIPAWSSLSGKERKIYARMMEVYAAMLAYQDAQIGRLLDELDRTGQRDNTLILFIEGDNGASAEGDLEGTMNEIGTLANGAPETLDSKLAQLDAMGGPDTYQNYPVGWAWAMNSPFQWTKQVASHLGGTRNGMVISWPAMIHEHGLRSQFGHVVDIYPTILDLVGLPAPTSVDGVPQQHIDGVSLAYTLDANSQEKPRTQYFEMVGNRAIYKNGWMAATTPLTLPWTHGGTTPPLDYDWELYDLAHDFSEANNVATKYPDKLAELKRAFDEEATRNQVFPLDNRTARSAGPAGKRRTHFEYWRGGLSFPQAVAPNFGLRSFNMEADIVAPDGPLSGPLMATGSAFGGWSFYFDHGRPVVVHAASNEPGDQFRIEGAQPLTPGAVKLRYEYQSRGMLKGGTMTIFVNGQQVARGEIGRSAMIAAGIGETFDVGSDTAAAVTGYPEGAVFSGEIKHISIELR